MISLRVMVAAALLLALMIAVSIATVLPGEPVHADTTFTVDRSDDPDLTATPTADDCTAATANDCSLRGAINAANNNPGADTIDFTIPSTDCNATNWVCTISPSSELPAIIQPATIDGYTQGDATATTDDDATENDILVARDGTNAKLLIELSGANAGSVSGLTINAPNVLVRGLVINRFGGSGIFISGDGAGAVIGGNFIGTDPSGTQSLGNGTGVTAFGGGADTIGGREAAAHNLISGNFHGLTIASNTGNTIQGNLIGTDKDGKNNLGNFVEGIGIGGTSNNIIGSAAGDNDFDSNLIAFNGDEGIRITGGTGNRILNNRIHSNGKLGINLVGGKEDINGVTRNDGKTKDRDTGANNLQNFPGISSASTEGTTTTIKGTLRSSPRKTFIIQLFSSSQKDLSGFGEGQEFMGERRVKTDRDGRGSFTFKTGAITGAFVTATATKLDPTTLLPKDTSEFSAAKRVT